MKNIITQEEKNKIDAICTKYEIINYTINPDGSIDVIGNVYITGSKLKQLPLKFGKVSGNFDCGYNKLTSLEHCPSTVGGNFECFDNHLTSLEFSPSVVGMSIYCGDNKLPNEFVSIFVSITDEERRIFFKYQHQFFIWDDGGYDHEAALDLVEEIRDGLL